MRRSRWIIGIGVALVIIAAGVIYTVHSASTVNPPPLDLDQGARKGTPLPYDDYGRFASSW